MSRSLGAQITKVIVVHPGGKSVSLSGGALDKFLSKEHRFDKPYGSTIYPGDIVDVTWSYGTTYCSVASWSAYQTSESSVFTPTSTSDTNFNDTSSSVQKISIPASFAAPGSVTIGSDTAWSGNSNIPQPPQTPAPCTEQNLVGTGSIYVSATASPTPGPSPSPTPVPTPSASPTPCYLMNGGGLTSTSGSINNLLSASPTTQPLSSYLASNKIHPVITINTATPQPVGTGSVTATAATSTVDPSRVVSSADALNWNASIISYLSTLNSDKGYQNPTQILFHELDHFFYEKYDVSAAERPVPLQGDNAYNAQTMALFSATFTNADGTSVAINWTNTVSNKIISTGYDGYVHLLIHNDLVNEFGSDQTGALREALNEANSPPLGQVDLLVKTYQKKVVAGSFKPLVASPRTNATCP